MSTYSNTAAPTKHSADSVNQRGTIATSLAAGTGIAEREQVTTELKLAHFCPTQTQT